MKQIFAVTKSLFKQSFRQQKSGKRSKGGNASTIVAYVILGIVFAPMLLGMLFLLSKLAGQLSLQKEYLSIIFFSIEAFTLFFGTIMLINTLFFAKDSEFLSTLPISSTGVFTAKLLYVAIQELLFSLLVGGLGLIFIVAFGGAPWYTIPIGLIFLVLVPILPLLISSILIIPLMYVLSFLKKKPVLNGIAIVAFFVGGMYLYMSFIMNVSAGTATGDIGQMIIDSITPIANKLPLNPIFAQVVLLQGNILLNVAISLGSLAALFALSMIIAKFSYAKGLMVQAEKGSTKDLDEKIESTSVIKALIKKDLREIFRFPTMFYYCGSQIFLAPLMIVIMSILMKQNFGGGTSAEEEAMMLSQVVGSTGVMFLFMFSNGANYFATSAITRENNNLFYMKTMPIPFETQIKAKVILAGSASVLTGLLSVIILMIFGLPILTGILYFILVCALTLVFVPWQIRIDLDKPKLGWNTVTEGLKNNKSSLVTMFASMGIAFGAMILSMVWIFAELPMIIYYLIYVVAILVTLLIGVNTYKSLLKRAPSLFDKIEE